MNPILLRNLRWVAVGVGGLVLAFLFALACTFVYLAPALPTSENIHRVQQAAPLQVLTSTGSLVSQFGERRQIPVEFDDIPLLVQQAVLAAEDDRFFQHTGLDWMGVMRAAFKTATGGSSQGGSTISQQAARNLVLTLDKTLRRKLSEIFVTWRMERDFSKEQILSAYLNVIFFGERSYGIAAAAQTYYGKRLDELSVAQAATLAGIIQLPSVQNPIANPKRAEGRRTYVLRRMRELGFIDSDTAEDAALEPVATRGFAPLVDVEADYVAEMARREFIRRFGESALNAGYKVITTLDDRLQTAANRAQRVKLMEYDRRHGYRGPLGKVDVPAAPSDSDLNALLAGYSAVGPLRPAVVLQVDATSATVHVLGRGEARIGWDGLSWARKAQRSGVGPEPRRASDVVKRGDVVHVVTDSRGAAQLAQQPRAQAALVALDPVDGRVVALVGGFDFHGNQYNRATQANRQPGSSFKPFLYSAALENGFTPASTWMDAPILVEDTGSEVDWKPRNSGGEFKGIMRLREALVLSKNTVSIRILRDVGIDKLIEHASLFGFEPRAMPRNETLALGSQSVTPWQMARGFAVFANGGFLVEPYFIQRIEDAEGKVVYEAAPLLACAECEPDAMRYPDALDVATVEPAPAEGGIMTASLEAAPMSLLPPLRGMDDIPDAMRDLARVQGGRGYLPGKRLASRVISPQNAWLMADIMHDVTTRGTARRTQSMGRDDLAGKTGTTDEGKDNWFNGFTGNLVASVWVGHDDNTSLGEREEGSTTALPIWMSFMSEALKSTPSSRLPRPPGLVDVRVSSLTGKRAHALDPTAVIETFMVSQLPAEPQPGDPGYLPPGAEPGMAGSAGAETVF